MAGEGCPAPAPSPTLSQSLEALLLKPQESQDAQFKNHSSGGNTDWFNDLPQN